eukprot:scaffold20399_cov60-Phaeocystis_antarctica.AAC.8
MQLQVAVALESCRYAVGGGRVAGWLGMGTVRWRVGGVRQITPFCPEPSCCRAAARWCVL